MSVGDVKSQERGAGARYNDGKVPLELIPVWILARVESHDEIPKFSTMQGEVRFIIGRLAQWQAGRVSAIDIVSQIRLSAIEEAARVFAYGAKKYAAWNWIKGMAWSVPLGCALRHAFAILRGEELDPESGLPHRGHLVCNLVMLAQFERTYLEGDDRPVKWLSTKGPEAPTGGCDSQEGGASAPESGIEIEQPQYFDPWYRGQDEPPPVAQLPPRNLNETSKQYWERISGLLLP